MIKLEILMYPTIRILIRNLTPIDLILDLNYSRVHNNRNYK